MKVTIDEQLEIEKRTRGQSTNNEWFKERRGRISASLAKQACGKGVSAIKKIITLQKPKTTTVPSLKYGIDNESVAAQKYQQQMEKQGNDLLIDECGLFVSVANGQLAASPDRIVTETQSGNKGCLEIKCLFKHRDVTPTEAVKSSEKNSSFALKCINDKITLKERHAYFYQIQMQMAITNLPWCDIVFFTNKNAPVLILRISFDKIFWEKTKEKLLEFHNSNIIPALVALQFKG